MAATNTNSSAKATKLERQRQALEYRRMAFGYAEIAERIGISTTQAFRLVREAMQDARTQIEAEASEMKAEEISRLDGMMRGLWPDARKGQHGAVDRVLKIMERRAKLLGLDAPVKLAQTNKEGDEDRDPTSYVVPVPPGMELQAWLATFAQNSTLSPSEQ